MSPLTRREALAAGVGALSLAGGCLGPNQALPERPDGSWTHRAHDSRNTGATPATVPASATPAWDAGEAHMAAPLVDDGTVYSVSHELTALDAKTGDTIWEADFDGKADHAPAALSDRLVVGADDWVHAIDRADGTVRWSTSLDEVAIGPVTASPDGSLVTVPIGNERLQAFDPESGDRRWHASIVNPSQAAIADGTVYVTGYRPDGDTGLLEAVSASDGAPIWEVDIEHPDAPPVVAAEGLVVADAGTLALHDPADGTRVRDLGAFGNTVAVPPAIADGTAYVAAGDGGLAAVSLADGSIEWEVDVQVTVDTGITVGAEAVVAPLTDLPGVVAFERSDGSLRWEHPIEGFDAYASTPAILADGAVFYASNESLGVVALGDLQPATE